MLGFFKGSALFAVVAVLLVIQVEGKHKQPERKCYFQDKNHSEFKTCKPVSKGFERNFCNVYRVVLDTGDEVSKDCKPVERDDQVYCDQTDCWCDADGCNKDWATCVASINRTNDPTCERLFPERRCYFKNWLSEEKSVLQKCELMFFSNRMICKLNGEYSGGGEKMGCEEVSNGYTFPVGCFGGVCYCDTDGCNKDWETCLASSNATGDPECQIETRKNERKCYHDEWRSHKQNLVKKCEDTPKEIRNVCMVNTLYIEGYPQEQKGCKEMLGTERDRFEGVCNGEEGYCYCDTDGCNKDWLTCLASINRTYDRECLSKVRLYPAAKCYHNDELKDCKQLPKGYRSVCRIRLPYPSTRDNHLRSECSEFWDEGGLYCNSWYCYCDTVGCNKDWDTCVASLNRTDDPSCKLKTELQPERKCYHDKWLSHKQNELLSCQKASKGYRNVCLVRSQYIGYDDQKGCEQVWDGYEVGCTDWYCECDTDGCNKDLLTCLASINRTNDLECLSKARFYPERQCYHDNELKNCGQAPQKYRSVCRVRPNYSNPLDETKNCDQLEDHYSMFCNKWDCYCDTDECNKDWTTCVASLNRTNDPWCQLDAKN